jgi:hypothetical protein
MLAQFSDKVDLLRAVGYGVPSPDVAGYSTLQRPTLILESTINLKPDNDNRRRVQLVDLPLPRDVLARFGDQTVEVSVTLSYFTEPNENLVRTYSGFGLRWRLQAPLQSDANFFRSFNRLASERDPSKGETLRWKITEQTRQRGTVQSDRCTMTAAELANCGRVAVFPTLGWWEKFPERIGRDIRYALIVTIDAGDADVDLYNPIRLSVSTPLDIDVTT